MYVLSYALCDAATNGDLEKVKKHIRNGFDIEEKDWDGNIFL